MDVRALRPEGLLELLALYEHLHEADEPPPSPDAAQAAWNETMLNPGIA